MEVRFDEGGESEGRGGRKGGELVDEMEGGGREHRETRSSVRC